MYSFSGDRVCLLSLSIVILRFFHVVAYISGSFFCASVG